MIYAYIIFGIYYFLNLIIFSCISYRKTACKKESNDEYGNMISLLKDNHSVSEPLLDNYV